MYSKMAGAKWQHTTTKGKIGMFAKRDSRVKAAIRIVWLMWTYDVG